MLSATYPSVYWSGGIFGALCFVLSILTNPRKFFRNKKDSKNKSKDQGNNNNNNGKNQNKSQGQGQGKVAYEDDPYYWLVPVLHGVVVVVVGSTALYTGSVELGHNSIAMSMMYFLSDFFVELLSEASIAMILHHVIGIATAAVVLVGGQTTWFYYVCLQTNESSTPFLYWFKSTNNSIAGLLFASVFFLSRIAANAGVIFTLYQNYDTTKSDFGIEFLCLFFLFYYLVQCFWFIKIVLKIQRTVKRMKSGNSSNNKNTNVDVKKPSQKAD